ncbi:hypothetical protein MWR46_08090 [Enterobacter hormaechei]|uniref:hypothetical protein n=1 Tax=Enterobacter hormaechei TaxID=158836 RepID=UPI002DBCE5E4|nr:hypothetical protein [Enterobacter hormaechei]MEB5631811.1 hypothetical protein [Enterobacter hormaechei]
MTFTKERLTELSRCENVGAILGEEIAELARIALASLEAEPVCVIDQANLDYLKSGSDADVWPASRIEMGDVLLYRAAMLQGADGTLTNEGTIPVTQFKPVADLYGLTSPTGGETSFTFDAVEARDFIDGGWSCQEYVELGRFQEAMLQNGNSPAQSDCCPEQNYIAPAQDGDSPVIPDGWVLVPEEPTHEMLEAGDEQFGTYDMYRRMIAASPQQK